MIKDTRAKPKTTPQSTSIFRWGKKDDKDKGKEEVTENEIKSIMKEYELYIENGDIVNCLKK